MLQSTISGFMVNETTKTIGLAKPNTPAIVEVTDDQTGETVRVTIGNWGHSGIYLEHIAAEKAHFGWTAFN